MASWIRFWIRCLTNGMGCALLPLLCLCLLCAPDSAGHTHPSAKRSLCQDWVSLSPALPDHMLTHLETQPVRCPDGTSDKDSPPPLGLTPHALSLALLRSAPLSPLPLFLPQPSDIRGMLPLALAPPHTSSL